MNELISELNREGFCLISNFLTKDTVAEINASINAYIQHEYVGCVYEEGSKKLRAIHGCHLFEPYFKKLAEHPAFIDINEGYFKEDFYLHQFKINMKPAFVGESWPWHQDFPFWQDHDNILAPNLLNIAIFLNDVSFISGPLCVIPRSHSNQDVKTVKDSNANGWRSNVSAKLSHQTDSKNVENLLNKHGVVRLEGGAGDIVLFHPELVHCSSNNLSACERRIIVLTYNAVSNSPNPPSSRPEFLCAKDYLPIK